MQHKSTIKLIKSDKQSKLKTKKNQRFKCDISLIKDWNVDRSNEQSYSNNIVRFEYKKGKNRRSKMRFSNGSYLLQFHG